MSWVHSFIISVLLHSLSPLPPAGNVMLLLKYTSINRQTTCVQFCGYFCDIFCPFKSICEVLSKPSIRTSRKSFAKNCAIEPFCTTWEIIEKVLIYLLADDGRFFWFYFLRKWAVVWRKKWGRPL